MLCKDVITLLLVILWKGKYFWISKINQWEFVLFLFVRGRADVEITDVIRKVRFAITCDIFRYYKNKRCLLTYLHIYVPTCQNTSFMLYKIPMYTNLGSKKSTLASERNQEKAIAKVNLPWTFACYPTSFLFSFPSL